MCVCFYCFCLVLLLPFVWGFVCLFLIVFVAVCLPRKYYLARALLEVSISTPRPSSTNCLQASVLNAPSQTTNKTGTKTHPSADGLPQVALSPQTPQNTPPDVALPIRGTRSSSTHQNIGTSPSHQEAYTSHWTNLTHWGQTPEARGTTTLQPAERRPQTE